MTDPFGDRIAETSTTQGTGTLSLAGAKSGFVNFVSEIGDGNECYYLITDGTDWEIGIGTVTDAATDTLSRDTVEASSNSDAAVNWGSGTRDVYGSPTLAALFNKLYDGSLGFYTDSGVADAYVITPSPNIQSYKTGQTFRIAIQNANTGACTVNVNSLGVKNVKLQDGNDPAAGAIQASIHTFVFDGTNLVLLDPFDEGLDEKVKVSANDTTADYLNNKITTGDGIVTSEQSDGGDEDLQFAIDKASQGEAEAGTNDTKVMTPLRTAEAITALSSGAADIRLAFLLIAENAGDRVNMVDGIADPFADETDVDTATSTNEIHDAAGDFYTGSGFAEGDSVALDKDQSGLANNSYRIVIDAAQYSLDGDKIKITFESESSGTGSDIDAMYVGHGTAGGNAWDFDGNQVQVTFDGGSTTKAVSAGATATSDEITIAIDETKDLIVAIDFGTNGRARGKASETGYATFEDTSKTASQTAPSGLSAFADDIVGIQKFEINAVQNMTLVSDAFTADTAPDTGRAHVQVKENEAITVNDDLTYEISRDGGTTWTEATLAAVETLADGTVAYEDDSVDISGQPSGTSMKYRIKTLNTKDIEVHGVVFQWA